MTEADEPTVHEGLYNFIKGGESNPFRTPMPVHLDIMFNFLAVGLAKHQYDTIPAYKRWVDQKAKTHGHPEDWTQWEDILPFPVTFFKKMDVGVGDEFGRPSREWLSSGTTSDERSRTPLHSTLHYDLAIGREAEAWLKQTFLNRTVGLMPKSWQWRNSSLAYMFDAIFGPDFNPIRDVTPSRFTLNLGQLVDLLDEAEQSQLPITLYGTSYAFIQMFEGLDLSYALPKGSTLIDTGGYKGIVENRTRSEFLDLAQDRLGDNMTYINEYGMSELSSQFWSKTQSGMGDTEVWQAPYWVRTRVVNPVTYEDDPDGVLVVYDLANVWVPFALQTEDLAKVHHQTLVPLGRARGAVAKGCSLTVESALKGGLLH